MERHVPVAVLAIVYWKMVCEVGGRRGYGEEVLVRGV